MSVGTFKLPDFGPTGPGSTENKTRIENCLAVVQRLAGPFAPHEQTVPNMTVRVESGPVWVNGVLTEKAAQDSATITAPTTNPRIDRVVKDSQTGTISVVTGAEAASPSPPDIPTGKEPICQVLLLTTTTAIDNTMITDERVTGGGAGEAFPVNAIYQNLGVNPATELGYGTWQQLSPSSPSYYPPAQSDTYVKATSKHDTTFWPYFATDPAKSLTGSWTNNSWLTPTGTQTNQRFHIDLGIPLIINRIYYENVHDSGAKTGNGAKNFTLWGSNDPAAFADLTYGNDAGWTQLTCEANQFAQHVGADQADPHYINILGARPYRYYAIKIADWWGGGDIGIGLRRIELQDQIVKWLRTA